GAGAGAGAGTPAAGSGPAGLAGMSRTLPLAALAALALLAPGGPGPPPAPGRPPALAAGTADAGPAPQLAGGLTALPPREPAGADLLANGGFDTVAEGLPDGWSLGEAGRFWSLDPGRSGRALRLSGVAGQRQVPTAAQTVTLEPGFYTLEGWVKAEGLGAPSDRSGVRLCLDARPRLRWWTCTEVVRGTRDWTPVRLPMLPVTDPGPYRVTVGAYGLPGGTAWFDDVRLARVASPPLDVYLLYPNFRGMLFDDRPPTVRVAVGVYLEPARLARARVRLALVDEEGGAVRARREDPAARRFTAELDASALGPGAFRLRAELVDAGGQTLFRYPDYRIVKVPAGLRETFTAWYDEHNVTHLRGRPVFVVGLYTTGGYASSPRAYAQGTDGWGTARMTEVRVDLLINYWLGAAPMPALGALLD